MISYDLRFGISQILIWVLLIFGDYTMFMNMTLRIGIWTR